MGRGEQECACPRCGYDLSGQVAAWHPGLVEGELQEAAKCPLEGTCSECGLVFEWRFLMRPELLGPSWFVETPRPSRGRRSAVRTLLRLTRPHRFWREVRLEQPIVAGRIGWWLCVALVLVPVIVLLLMRVQFAVVLAARNVATAIGGSGYVFGAAKASLLQAHDSLWAEVRILVEPKYWPSWFTVGIAMTIAFAMMLVILPHSRRVSKIRMAMVLRVFAYSWAWVALVFCVACLYEPLCVWVNTRPWTIAEWDYGRGVRALAPLPVLSGTWGGHAHVMWTFICALWLNVYWWFALRDGLRMNHHRVVFACCAVPAVLVGAITLILDPSDIMWAV